MSVTTGKRLGAYEVQAPLGAGGMGEVYRAMQTNLGRQVAIKILSQEVTADSVRLQRFEQEARSASALNHPNIVSIYDVGRDGPTAYIAMEYVDGKTLRALLREGPLGVKKTLQIAAQIAEGLAKAHSAGIVHRDLKPENVMVTRDGVAKILDFGLAKLGPPAEGVTQSMGVTVPATTPGTVLGTVGYMSPEQARGEAADFRSDVFSFGSMLYEMVTGKPPFKDDSSAQTLAAIIEDEPQPVSELNPKTPAPLRWIIERCMAKDPEERYASTRDLASDLRGVRDHLSGAAASALAIEAPTVSSRRRWVKPLPWILVGALVGALLGTLLAPRPESPLPTFHTLTFSGTDYAPSVSPDGRTVAFVSRRDGKQRIWLKQLESGSEAALTPGPQDSGPRFSRDGSWILFTSGGVLYRIPSFGGEARKLLDKVDSADWSPDNREIVFMRSESEGPKVINLVGIVSVQENSFRIIRRFENQQFGPPSRSPTGQWIALSPQRLGTAGSVTRRFLVLLSRSGDDMREVVCPFPGGAPSYPSWSGNGKEIIYEQPESAADVGLSGTTSTVGSSGRVFAQNIYSGKARLLFAVQALLTRVEIAAGGRAIFDALVQRNHLKEIPLTPEGAVERWLTHGNSIDRQPFFSPDGEFVIFTSSRSGDVDLWEISLKTDALRRLTDHPAADWDPFVTRDGKYLLWSSNRSGPFEIWMAERDGSSPRQVSHDGYDAENPVMNPDGWVLYASSNPEHPGIWKIRPDGTQPSLLVAGLLSWPDVSPDGQFVLYHALAGLQVGGGRIYVVRVADGRPVSFEAQGSRARFSSDGHSIVYVDPASGGIVSKPFPSEAGLPVKMLVRSPEDSVNETFEISPNGKLAVVSYPERIRSIMMVEGGTGISPPIRSK